MLDAQSRLVDFPSLEGRVYLNSAAESIPPQAVHEAAKKYWQHKSMGMDGRVSHNAEMEVCRESAARMLEKKVSEISFCSCSSEAYNLLGSALALGASDEVVVSDLDFPAGATPWLTATARPEVKLWENREGELELEDLESLLSERTQLVQVSLVSFLNGYRLPWVPFRDLVRRLAPNAILSVDITQAFGRVELDCLDADCIISSTHKWILGSHGGCVVAIPEAKAERLTTHAGGWFHIDNPFGVGRFEQANVKKGVASFSVGMPNYPAIYALRAGMDYIQSVGVAEIARHADPLVQQVHEGLADMGIKPMAPFAPDCRSGIVAFMHEKVDAANEALRKDDVHVMHHAGRIRIAVHGYNQQEDVDRLLAVLRAVLV
ncbi:MAG: aminotransferase class V-fold PLP-dependent enzyme [Verrucomicrobia bacterium]|nr:aminotransferase class V-fold PLP-dependent enzyme [Verrucomicrobiota bacterium]